MAQDQQTVKCPAHEWTQITNADVTNITFETLTAPVYIRFTTDTTTPTESEGILYPRRQGEANKALSDMTALVGADRVWAKPVGGRRALVFVDHA